MINLRYHVVSLVAVFLALTLGIVMGSTVIDRVIVDDLNRRVDSVRRSVSNAEAENGRLRAQLRTVQDFADQARDQLAEGHLKGIPVLIVGVAGIDRKPVDALRDALVQSSAAMTGSVWFTAKMRLDNDADTRALAAVVGVTDNRVDVVRRAALGRLASAFGGQGEDNLLPALVDAGFLAFEPPPSAATSTVPAITSLPSTGVRVVLVSGAGAAVGDDQVAIPLAAALSQAPTRLVAAESGQDTPGGRGVFVGLLRKDPSLGPRVSTVDDLESPMGQAAAVLALEDLGVPRTGHYGVGPDADRLLPPTQA